MATNIFCVRPVGQRFNSLGASAHEPGIDWRWLKFLEKLLRNNARAVVSLGMANAFLPPRRWYGLLCLVLGAAMLFWGQTLLKDRLGGKTFVIYWGICFLVTGLALIISLWDSYQLRRQMRQQEKALFKHMLDQVEKASRTDSDKGECQSQADPPEQAR